MKLVNLLKNIAHVKEINFNPNINSLSCNTEDIVENCLFACLKGVNYDGHDFAKKALSLGATAILTEKDLNLPNQILVEDSHKAYAKICANFYGNPSKKLKFIGVTGTNGKTSVTKIIKEILMSQGKVVGLIGTIQNEINYEIINSKNTTPTHLDFQKLLSLMVEKNCEYVVMEVSSHALIQERLADTEFEIAIFTNLSQDHLDYHITMKNYFNAKKLLFQRCKTAIICIDDPYGEQLLKEIKCTYFSFAIENEEAEFLAKEIKINSDGVQYVLQTKNYVTNENSNENEEKNLQEADENQINKLIVNETIKFSTPGKFSVYNTMAAFICCFLLGIKKTEIVKTLNSCKPIKGRSEKIKTDTDFTVICDYAHSPAGLKNILDSINSYKKTRVLTLFGCGGDRDKLKRPKMGEIAAKNSDFLIITSDNPRTEKPEKIIDDIIKGVKKTNTPYVKISNRKKAIFYAIKNAKKDDIILLAGKGHETYQVIGRSKINMDEREIVKDAVDELLKEKEREF